MKYFILKTEGVIGYSAGIIDEENVAPEGAEIFENKREYNKGLKAADKEAEEAVNAEILEMEQTEKDAQFTLYVAGMTPKEVAKKYPVEDVKKYARNLGLDITGKEVDVAKRILDHLYN